VAPERNLATGGEVKLADVVLRANVQVSLIVEPELAGPV